MQKKEQSFHQSFFLFSHFLVLLLYFLSNVFLKKLKETALAAFWEHKSLGLHWKSVTMSTYTVYKQQCFYLHFDFYSTIFNKNSEIPAPYFNVVVTMAFPCVALRCWKCCFQFINIHQYWLRVVGGCYKVWLWK